MARGGARRFLRVQAVVETRRLLESVLPPARLHELPHPGRLLARNGPRLEARFRLRQVDQLLGNALLVEDAPDQRPVAARALHTIDEHPPPAPGRKEVDVGKNRVGDLKGELGRGRFQLLHHLVFKRRVYRERQLRQDVFERRLLEPGLAGGVARAQFGQVEAVDGVDQFVELLIGGHPYGGVFRRGQQEVDGPVELAARGGYVPALIIGPARLVVPFRLADQNVGPAAQRRRRQRGCEARGIAQLRRRIERRRVRTEERGAGGRGGRGQQRGHQGLGGCAARRAAEQRQRTYPTRKCPTPVHRPPDGISARSGSTVHRNFDFNSNEIGRSSQKRQVRG